MAPARPPYFEAAGPRLVAIQLLISIVCIIGEGNRLSAGHGRWWQGKVTFFFPEKTEMYNN